MNFHDDATELATADPIAPVSPGEASPEPLGGEDFAPEIDPFAGASSRSKLNGGAVLIVAVILTAAAGLFSMRKIAEVTRAAGIDSEIESTIVKFLDTIGERGAGMPASRSGVDYESLLGVITESYSEQQVPLQDVQRDPFVIETEVAAAAAVPDEPEVDPEVQEAAERARRREAKQVELKRAAEGLRLKSIIGGSTPMALIEGEILRVGDSITPSPGDDVFHITEIGRSSVELFAEVSELDLKVRVTLFLSRDR